MTFENFGKRPSLCSFCSRMKRGMLYSCMREHGYTCLALGQHLDDGEYLTYSPICR
jgi:tRNA(Ile)-lysidine synthase TilS/MesJ